MIPQQQDFELYRGDDEQISLLITNDDGSSLSLNGLRFDLQAVVDRETVLELSTENGLITIEQNEVILNIPHVLTAHSERLGGLESSLNVDLVAAYNHGKESVIL